MHILPAMKEQESLLTMADSGDEEEEQEYGEEEEEEEQEEEHEDVRDNKAADDDDDEDEEEEEEGQDEYEKDDFIVDEEEEEEEEADAAKNSGDEEAKAKKKKRKKRGEERYLLDEDDYDLLEANVTGFHRPQKVDNNKKFKRLKKAGRVTGEKGSGGIGLSDEDDEDEGGGRRGRTAEEELKRSLFGDDEGGAPDVRDDEELEEEEEEEMGEEDDEMADFIVDEEDVDELGQPSRRKKVKKKKKPFRQAPGINSIALQEAQEIFGDVSSLLEERRKHMMTGAAGLDDELRDDEKDEDDYGHGQRAPPQKLLEKQFEPSLLEEKFLTEKDDRLRETDLPERLQILEEAAGAFPEPETATREADWIFDRAFGHLAVPVHPELRYLSKMDKAEIVKQIANVLQMVHDEKLELPFIAMYRREECLDLLGEPDVDDRDDKPKIQDHEALWAVQHWDKKWLLLQGRKMSLQAAYERRIPIDARDDPEKDDLVEKLLCALADAPSEQAIDDVDAKFNLHFPPDEVEIAAGGFKRPKRRSFYSICRKAGLASVAKHFGLSPDQFGENLLVMYKRHDVEDEAFSPDELASRFCARANETAGEFRDPQSVIKGARHMVSVEISTEPAVREYVRNIYTDKAVVSTKPTAEGNGAIDAFHPYAGVKWLLNKPVNAFCDEQWLLIQKAEEEKQLEVTIGLPKDIIESTLMQEFESLYLSEGVSLTAQQWNEHRRQILRDALVSIVLPSMEKEARMIMAARAKHWLAAECGLKLWKKVSMAPYVPPKVVDTEDRIDSVVVPRVLACCWGPGNPATTFVMLDSAGEVMNVLYTGYLNIRAASPEQQQRKNNDQDRLLQFMRDYQPHVVVLGAANLQCRHLQKDIFEHVIFKVVEQHPRDLAEGLDMIKVVYGDESIPSLYENSQVSQEQLPGQPGIVRRAVALGRFFQNPVAMIASLCGPAKEVLSLHLHPMQSSLNSEEVYEAIERVMVTVTNQVGIDINLAASHDWLFSPLQFIAGLGPRKAGAIQRAIQSVGRVSTRKELYARLMGKKVFINSAGFIRVRGTGQAASGNSTLDPLDDTRIHPESYLVAKNMAEAAFKEEARQNDEDVDDDFLEMAVEHVMTNPNVLSTVDIEEYAQDVEVRGQTKRVQTLELIKSELQYGFREWRFDYTDPNPDEEFYMLSGESEETLAPGRLVQATVRKVQQNRVMCVLESGLLGFIQKEDISDEPDVVPSDKVAEGSMVTCRVKDVDRAKYIVDLTCKGSDLRGDFWGDRQRRDPYYSEDKNFLRLEYEKARKRKEEEKKKAFKPRMIVHPQFQNVPVDEAIKALEEKDVGEVIIRPSSKGPTHLSMTLKISDGVYTNIDILEGGKEGRDVTSFLSLGKTLTIDGETYEDLDEVIARYVDPVVSFLREMLQYRKFKHGSKVEIDETLRSEKVENPKRIPYSFSIAHEHPGAFMLSYIRSINPHHEYISISPKGFRYRKRNFENIDKLVAYFQKHFNDPIPEAPPRRALAAMVPPRSPAPSAYSPSSFEYSSGSGKPPNLGGFGYDNGNGWDRGGGARGGRGGGWGGGRGNGGRGQDYGQGGNRSSAWGKGSWANAGSSQGGGWDKAAGTTSSGGAAWVNDTGTTNSGGGGWDSTAGGVSSGGDNWGKVGTTSNSTEGVRSGWESGTGGGWNNAPAASRGAWENGSGGNGQGGARWNQRQDSGGGGDQGGWDQAGSGVGNPSGNNWGQGAQAASSTPARTAWTGGGTTAARSGDVGGNWGGSGPSGDYASGAQGQAAADDRNRGSSKVDTPRGDWGSLEPAAPGVSRGEIEPPAPSSTGAWNQGKDSEPEASDWGKKFQPPASTGDARGKESDISPKKTSSFSGWDVPAESNEGDGWGELSPVASGGGDKASGGWDQLDSSPGGGWEQGRGGGGRGRGGRGRGGRYGGNGWGRQAPPQPVPPGTGY